MSNEELRKQIHTSMALKQTDELLDIWQTNNRGEWSDEAFDVVKQILQERGIELPEQDAPLYESSQQGNDGDVNGLEEWEAIALDDDNQPEFYNTLEVITLKININKTLKAVIILNILSSIILFQWVSSIVGSYFPNRQEIMPLVYLIAFIFTTLSAVVQIAIIYFPLKALVHILRILMQIEFTSRKSI